jgi:hypothetical protein
MDRVFGSDTGAPKSGDGKLPLIEARGIVKRFGGLVCTENLILIDYVTESPNVDGDDRAAPIFQVT